MIKHPFAGWPRTEAIEDGYSIEAVHQTPLTRKAADIATVATIAGSIWHVFVYTSATGNSTTLFLFILLQIPFFFALRWLLRLFLRKHTSINFFPGSVVINNKANYEASRIETFSVGPHIKAEAEEREMNIKLQTELQTGKLKPQHLEKLRLYQDTLHIYMIYHGQPVIVADVYGRADAEKLTSRMIALFNLVNDDREWKGWEFDRDPVENKRKSICNAVFMVFLGLAAFWPIGPVVIGAIFGIIQIIAGDFGLFALPNWVWFALIMFCVLLALNFWNASPYTRGWLWQICKRFWK